MSNEFLPKEQILLLYPHQLFSDIKTTNYDKIYLLEDPKYFTDFKYHKLKLVYHRASMKNYYHKYYDKHKKHKKMIYVEYDKVHDLYKELKSSKNKQIVVIKPADFDIEDKLEKYFKDIIILENKNFLIKITELTELKKIINKNKKYSHDSFYKYQRKKLNILIKGDKPEGGKWSFDNENRLPLPKDIEIPKIKSIKKNKYITESINYVNKHFPNNYGSTDNFFYPIDSKSAKKWLDDFLKNRLKWFGLYEDAVDNPKEPFVFHSVLSPMMNIGIITDIEVVNISYDYYKKHSSTIPIQSFEGFIRQIIGWRNYVYTLYLLEGREMFESNFMKHHNNLPYKKFWEGTTGMMPIDSIINKIQKYGYAHHIERLMYLGNFMLLCFIDPKDVYKIFMEWTIDSGSVFMVPNVMGMSQYATTIMMTRPYFSSSNYINKMSTYKRNGEWDVIWDSLYYNFIDKHQDFLKKNYAIAQQVKHWNNKTESEKKELKKTANKYLKQLLED